jgi:PKD repeat protein
MTYLWDFGDGGTSTATSPYHIYTTTGTYTVRLIVHDGPCTDTLVRTNYISVGGTNLSFTASDTFSSCPPLTVNFVNTSTIGYNYVWSFGNGNASTLTTPSTFYANPGVYVVKLSGQNGICFDTISKTITVTGPSGTFSYSPLTGCAPLTVNFTSTNTNTPVLIWDMNNGVTVTTTSSSTSYTYTQPGKYVPKLLLSDGASCIIPILGSDTITVSDINSDFTFAPSTLCQSGTIQFHDTVYYSTNGVTSRSWTFGDGGTSTSHNPVHTYAAPGNYTVRMIVSNGAGCNDTVIKTVNILPPPNVIAGGANTICQGSTTPIQLQASGAATYTWTPSTGLSCTNCANPTVTPTTTTTYTVIGVDTNGCSDTGQTTITITPLPTIQTGPNPTICAGASVQLAVTGGVSYSWSPATGLSCANCTNPIASPATTTTYTVTGTSAAGCSNTAQVTVTVSPIPAVSASATDSNICAGDTTQLMATGGNTFLWSPATGLSCTTCANPKATPTVTTTYTVTGSGNTGCANTASVTITVNPLPTVAAANQSVCSGFSAQLVASGASSYTWSPATGLSCTNCASPIATPTATTTYTITGTSSAGCVKSSQATVTVNQPPVLTLTNNQTICNGDAIPLSASGASTYTWTPGTGLSCNNCANPNASPTTTTTYTVVATDANGCRDTGKVTVTVNPLPVVDAGPD